jgi:uncharacterized protein with HEPN domain
MKDSKIYLKHILESIEMIEYFTKGLNKKEFLDKPEKQDAVVRRIEIIGEAVKNIPISLKHKHSEISWREIAGTRDVLIHSYFSVDYDLVWNIVRKDLPRLKKAIQRILDNSN